MDAKIKSGTSSTVIYPDREQTKRLLALGLEDDEKPTPLWAWCLIFFVAGNIFALATWIA